MGPGHGFAVFPLVLRHFLETVNSRDVRKVSFLDISVIFDTFAEIQPLLRSILTHFDSFDSPGKSGP